MELDGLMCRVVGRLVSGEEGYSRDGSSLLHAISSLRGGEWAPQCHWSPSVHATFQASAYIPLARAGHMAEAGFKGWENRVPLSMGGAAVFIAKGCAPWEGKGRLVTRPGRVEGRSPWLGFSGREWGILSPPWTQPNQKQRVGWGCTEVVQG